MQTEIEKLKELLFSGDASNIELARVLAKSQQITEIEKYYQKMERAAIFWTDKNLSAQNLNAYNLIPQLKEKGLYFYHIRKTFEIPQEQIFLAPFIKSLYVWHQEVPLPKGLGMFDQIERVEIHVHSLYVKRKSTFKEIPAEVWQLPKLKKIDIEVSADFEWSATVTQAQNIEEMSVMCEPIPTSLPPSLPQLSKLKRFCFRGSGTPKTQYPIPDILWDCAQLEHLELWGKTLADAPPNKIAQLHSLQTLVIYGTVWSELPQELLHLQHLRGLRLSELRRLKQLPEWFVGLGIKRLSLYKCKIQNAFEILTRMPQLEQLEISWDVQNGITKTQWETAFSHIQLLFI